MPNPAFHRTLGDENKRGQIVLRGAHMNEKSDSMEKKSTPFKQRIGAH